MLWLLRFGTSDAAEVSIRKEAGKLGLQDAEKRIVFTDPVPRRIHLRVKTLAHIFIDTPQYNGGSLSTHTSTPPHPNPPDGLDTNLRKKYFHNRQDVHPLSLCILGS